MLQVLLLQHMHVVAAGYCQAVVNCRFDACGSWNAD